MAPLTPPSGCVSCTCLIEKIAELEGRMSTLYQIREAELLIDTITYGPPQTGSTCAPASDASSSGPVAAAAAPPLDTICDDSWIRQGTKP